MGLGQIVLAHPAWGRMGGLGGVGSTAQVGAEVLVGMDIGWG